mgnify:FL=1
MANVTLTERAAKEVIHVTEEGKASDPEAPDTLYLRLKIQGGGCSGFTTKLDLDSNIDEKKDTIFEQYGVKIAVDNRSLLYADGAEIDFHEGIDKRGFTVNLPGATGRCGCGSSFSM